MPQQQKQQKQQQQHPPMEEGRAVAQLHVPCRRIANKVWLQGTTRGQQQSGIVSSLQVWQQA